SSVLGCSMQLGAVAATGLTASLLDPLGWRLVLSGYAVAGVVWSVVFYVWFHNHPEEHPTTNEAERQLIRSGRALSADDNVDGSRWRRALRLIAIMALNVSVWAYFIQALFRAYAAEFFYTWCPAFLEEAYHLDKKVA